METILIVKFSHMLFQAKTYEETNYRSKILLFLIVTVRNNYFDVQTPILLYA